MRDENEKATKEIMEAKHKLAQIKVLIDHSWLVLERCQDIKGQDAAVRRLANRIAHEMAELESTPKAKNYYLSKYLRLLRVLERRVSREAKEHKLPRENRLDAPHSSLESVES
ncbi:hypothetical protein KR018_000989 [Drosophila ironensis]|nr:hypothetical protein KR018_000989 [Drosophila ironensis]